MRKKLLALAVTGAVGLGGAAVLGPGLASAEQSPGGERGVSGRLGAIRDALKGLVTDGTLTQSQADRVASTLETALPRPPHRMRPGRPPELAEAARLLKMTPQQLRTALDGSTSLAQVAAKQGVSRTALIDALVTAARAHLAEAVKAGRLTQAQSDKISARLPERIGQLVDRTGPPPRRHGRGHDGGGADAPGGPGEADEMGGAGDERPAPPPGDTPPAARNEPAGTAT